MTRWSLFLQTLSLLHHFLGLYCLHPSSSASLSVILKSIALPVEWITIQYVLPAVSLACAGALNVKSLGVELMLTIFDGFSRVYST